MAGLLAAVISVLTVARERRLRLAQRADRREAALLLGALEALSLQLRCGSAPLAALSAVGDPHADARSPGRLLSRAGAAETLSAAAAELLAGPPALRALAAALRLSETAGTSLAGLADAICGPLREGVREDRELTDALAGVRSSADLLTGLPLLGLLLAEGIGARPLSILLHTTAGAVCLVLGVGLACLGRWWTERLVQAARAAGRA